MKNPGRILKPNWTELLEFEDYHGAKVLRLKKAVEWFKEHVEPVNLYLEYLDKKKPRRKK